MKGEKAQMHIKYLSGLAGLLVLASTMAFPTRSPAQSSTVDTALAEQYFKEAEALCERDRGRLWGLSLCGPMIFVDRKTRTVVANQADKEGILTASGKVFTGKLPEK